MFLLQLRPQFIQFILVACGHFFGLERADGFFVVLDLSVGVLEFALDPFELFGVLLADLWTLGGFLGNAEFLFLQPFG